MSKYVSRVSPGDCELITPKEFYARQGKEKKLKKRMEREPVVDTFEHTVSRSPETRNSPKGPVQA